METTDSPEVLERFEASLALVDIIARQVARSCGGPIELDDLIAYGREGLLDAARRYDSGHAASFRAYANIRVRGAVLDGVRQMSWFSRRAYERLAAETAATRASEGAVEQVQAGSCATSTGEVEHAFDGHLAAMATAAALSLTGDTFRGAQGEIAAVPAHGDPEEATARAELMAIVREHVERLPVQEAALVRRHYLQGERFDEVARDLNMSKSWASKLHTRALGRLSKRLREVSELAR